MLRRIVEYQAGRVVRGQRARATLQVEEDNSVQRQQGRGDDRADARIPGNAKGPSEQHIGKPFGHDPGLP